MSHAANLFDAAHDYTMDMTGEIFLVLDTVTDESPFEASVPEHLSEESVAHWNDAPIW